MQTKKIEGFNYLVSDRGDVFNLKGLRLKQQKNKDGYWTVNLKGSDKYYHRRVNRLVAEAFVPNPHNLPVVNHIDHDRGNNNLGNLEWETYSGNQEKSIEFNWISGKKRSRLSIEKVRQICQMIEDGYRNVEILKLMDVTSDEVIGIRKGKTWTEISKDFNLVSNKRGISESSVRWICRQLVAGKKPVDIVSEATSKEITRSVVSKIKNKRTFVAISDEYF